MDFAPVRCAAGFSQAHPVKLLGAQALGVSVVGGARVQLAGEVLLLAHHLRCTMAGPRGAALRI